MKNQLGTLRPSLSIYFRVALLAFCLMTMGVGNVWGYTWTNNYTVYFDKQNCTGFAATPYVRIGNNSDWSNAYAMTIVPGTKYLYSYQKTDGDWSNAAGFSVANNTGWVADINNKSINHALYQPTKALSENESGWVNNACRIMKQTTYQEYDINADCYIKIDDGENVKNTEYECTYYKVNSDNTSSLVPLPNYSITYTASVSHGSIAVYQYNGSDYNTSLSSGTSTLKPTQLIKIVPTPDANYAPVLTVTGATVDPDGDGSTYYITGDCEITATFEPRWNIKGTMGEGWEEFQPMDFVSESDFRGTIELTAHTAYRFKVFDRLTANDARYFGCSTRDHDYTYVGQTEEVPLQATGNALMLMTTVGGNYTFNWDSTAKTLQIVYPTTIKHPSMDYVYMERYSDWGDGTYCYLHQFYDDGVPDSETMTTWGSDNPKMTAYTLYKKEEIGNKADVNKNFYLFPIVSSHPNFIAKNNLDASSGGHETSKMNTSGHEGHYVYHNGSAWVWHTIQVYIELENNGADVKKGDLGRNVAFNDTSMNTAIVCPQKSNYTFGGYYTGTGGTGTQIINAEGEWQPSIADYTTADTAWIHAGDTTKLYAQWTETPRTITLQVSPESAGSFDVGGVAKAHGNEITAYISTGTPTITATPSHVAWKFARWEYSEGVGPKDDTGSDNTVKITSDRNGTLTAVFEPRFTLVGATEASSSVPGGMPGWSNYTAEFTVNSTDPVNLTYVCELNANTWYQCAIHDRVGDRGNLGDGTDGEFLITKDNHPYCTNKDMHMRFQTVGDGKYVFKIDEFDEYGYPKIKLYWPWQVNFGWKYANADAMSTLNEGGGGTLTVYAHEGGEKRAIVSSGGYIMHGGTVSYTAHPYDDYQLAGWWSDYGFSIKTNMDGDSVYWAVDKENAQLFAKFVEKTDTLKSGSTWSGGEWSTGSQPTADIVAVIKSPVQVDRTDAKAKKVLIMKNGGNTGQLEIPAGKELVVRTTIKKTTDGTGYGATGENDIIIGSSLEDGNGALVMGAHDGTNKATVYFATKAKTTGEGENKHNVNQFIGTPFNDEEDILYDYYGTKIYRFMAGHDGNLGPNNEWKRVASTGEQMHGFFGYNILTNQTESPVLEMTGQLSRTNQNIETIKGYYNGSSNTENMFANSWVAPIYIPNFKDSCFVNMERTIYIFNAGTPADAEGHAMNSGNAETTAAGQYVVLPVSSSPWTGLTVIPSMQAFSVFANEANPKLKFDYTNLVYNPATNNTAGITPNRAPKRTNEEDAPIVLKLRATGESGYAVNTTLLERSDFSTDFEDGWDGRFIAGDEEAPQMYAVTSDGNMAINCIPELEGTVLGFKAGTVDNTYTFAFEYDGDALYLFDTQTQIYTRVLTGNTYAFTTADDAAHNRFILTRNAPQTPTEVDNTNADAKAVKFIENDRIYIFRAGVLYDAIGNIVK